MRFQLAGVRRFGGVREQSNKQTHSLTDWCFDREIGKTTMITNPELILYMPYSLIYNDKTHLISINSKYFKIFLCIENFQSQINIKVRI